MRSAAAEAPLAGAWGVYVLACADGTLYVGATNDLARRLVRHAAGKASRYTRARLPVRLVWHEPSADRGAALRREAALKRLSRAEKLALTGLRRARARPPGGGTPSSPRR